MAFVLVKERTCKSCSGLIDEVVKSLSGKGSEATRARLVPEPP